MDVTTPFAPIMWNFILLISSLTKYNVNNSHFVTHLTVPAECVPHFANRLEQITEKNQFKIMILLRIGHHKRRNLVHH